MHRKDTLGPRAPRAHLSNSRPCSMEHPNSSISQRFPAGLWNVMNIASTSNVWESQVYTPYHPSYLKMDKQFDLGLR